MPTRINIGSLFAKSAKHYPDHLAIAQGDRELTYREANQRIDSFANALKKLGVRKGDRLAIFSGNCPEYILVMFACFKAGIVIVPMNFRFVAGEVAYHLNDPRCVGIVFSDENQDVVNSIREQVPTVKHFICLGKPVGGNHGFEELVSQSATSEDQTVDVEKDDLAWLFYTSGTTGRPKGAMLSHGNLMTVIWAYLADAVPTEPKDAALHVGALSHGAGMHALPIVAKGAPNIILDSKSFDPKIIAETIQKRKATNMFMVPTMIKMFVESPDIDQYDISSLQYIAYGGSAMYVEDLRFALKKCGQIFIQMFGQGESPMTGTILYRYEHVIDGTPEQVKRLGSAGTPRTGIEIKILDDDENELPAGQMGQICIRGETMMQGYWERPEENEKTLKGGWLHTGDVGYLDEQGYLFVMDRTKDMYISGGSNVYPREIEEIMLEHPAVSEVSVVGVPDEKWGESGKAVVVLQKGMKATEQELLEFCQGKMAGYKRPKSVDFVDALPKSPYGKILKREIREWYWKDETRRVR